MRRLILVLAGLAVLAAGALTAFVVHRLQEGGNVRGSPTVEYVPTTTPAPKPPLGIQWPMYGLDEARTRSLDLPLRPPFRRVWRYQAGEPRRVPAGDRLRAALLLDELRHPHGDQREDRQVGVEVPVAPLRRRVAGARAARARHRLRGLPQPAARATR